MIISKILSFFFVCMLASCGHSISQSNTNFKQPTNKTELFLRMERTECFGNCPVYVLTIKPDGKVLFENIKFREKGEMVTKNEKIESKLSEEKINRLISEINKADFFSLKDSYTQKSGNCPNPLTDAPTVILSINLQDREKTIPHYLGCYETLEPSFNIFPQKLYNLENKIDEIVETKRWIGERK